MAFFQENTAPGEKKYIFAHELGHCLGVMNPKHDNTSTENLMHETVQPTNPKEVRRQDWHQVTRP
jgi:Zn-dependent peptidase ImmA (M78 family)